MSTTPNMSLTIPNVGETLGPEWAELLNAALEKIDSHTHAPDSGARVTPAGIDMNMDLSFSDHSAVGVLSLALTDNQNPEFDNSVYTKSGELYYKDGTGTEVKITDNGFVNAGAGSIANLGEGGSSASFSNLGEDFSWYFNDSKLAAMNMGDIRLFPFDGSNEYTNKITLKAPTALASNYNLTLSATLPAAQALVQISSTGQLSYTNTFAGALLGDSGYSNVPTFSFSSDPNTGVYRSAEDVLTITTGGTPRLSISNTATAVAGNLTVGGTATVTGALSAASINTSSGGAFKAQVFTGTLAAEGTVTLTASTLTTVYGVCGFTKYAGTSSGQWVPIRPYPQNDVGGTGEIIWMGTSVGTENRIGLSSRNNARSLDYRVIVFGI